MTVVADRIGYAALAILSIFLRALPQTLALAIGRFAGRAFFYVSSRRRVAYADLKADDCAVVLVQIKLLAAAKGGGSYAEANFADGAANYIMPDNAYASVS